MRATAVTTGLGTVLALLATGVGCSSHPKSSSTACLVTAGAQFVAPPHLGAAFASGSGGCTGSNWLTPGCITDEILGGANRGMDCKYCQGASPLEVTWVNPPGSCQTYMNARGTIYLISKTDCQSMDVFDEAGTTALGSLKNMAYDGTNLAFTMLLNGTSENVSCSFCWVGPIPPGC